MRSRCWRIAERGSLLKVPPIYMDKIAIGPGFPEGLVDLDASPADNLKALATRQGRAGRARSPSASSTGRATPS